MEIIIGSWIILSAIFIGFYSIVRAGQKMEQEVMATRTATKDSKARKVRIARWVAGK